MVEDRYRRTPLDQVVQSRGDESIDPFGRLLYPTKLPVRDNFTAHQVEITNALFERYRNAHWAEIDLKTDNGAYEAAWNEGRGQGRVIDLQLAISPSDANAVYALERYQEDQKRARAIRTLFGNAA
jgi:hypothetical protein